METVKISNTDFIQKVIKLDGQNWRFTDRPYIYPIINNNFKRTILLAARQTEKSTSLSGILLAKACLNPNYSLLYVSPTGKQTGVFSRKKIDEAFETSPHLKRIFYPGVKGFRVEEKRLKNFSTMYFRSAFHDADSIRGITADVQCRDEFQDLLQEVVPVIEACSQKRKHAQFFDAGTPKTFDNPIHLKHEKSTSNEWHIKCMHCGHWNLLSIDNVLLDKPGLWCTKCQGTINSLQGVWVSARESEIQGFRLPYIILPENDIDWKDLFFKMRNYDTGALMNEVFGWSYDNGSKPITRDQLIASCSSRPMWNEPHPDTRGYQYYAGIDWGGGNSGFTILTIGYADHEGKFKIVYCKRFLGREAEPENVKPIIAEILMRFRANIIGADQGFGFGMNDGMKRLLSREFNYVTFRHSAIKKPLMYDEAGDTYVTNRTEVMTDLFSKLKMLIVEPFNWQEFEDFGKDYLNINSEYSERMRQLRYIHTQPDDAFHSALYAVLCWMTHTGQVISTRYTPGDDDIEPKLYANN